MNILFDCITLQNFVGGGGEYTLYFFDKLLRRAKEGQIKLYGVYSSKFGTKFYQKYVNDYDLELVDIEKGKLDAFVKERGITIFFIGIAQMYHQYDLSSVPCKIIAVCHDAREMSLLYDKNYASAARRSLIPVAHPRIKKIKMFLKYFLHYFVENNYEKSIKNKYKGLEKLFQNKNAHIITVSNYSKGNLLYYFDNIANPIRVFTPPHKIIPQNIDGAIENQELDSLIKSKKKYFLLVSCDRALKNAALFVEQWDKFCKTTNYEYYGVLVGDIARVNKQNIIQLPPLSTADLEQAYKNAFSFVFPSVAEGYGTPPMEAMKYGIPVVCSNATSMPEVYGDSVIYFSPYYKEDLFKALLSVIDKRDEYKEKSLKKYKEISKKQEKDAGELENFILEEEERAPSPANNIHVLQKTKKLNVGIYIADILYHTGGTESYSVKLCYALQQFYPNAAVTLVTEIYKKIDIICAEDFVANVNKKYGIAIDPKRFKLKLVYADKTNKFGAFVLRKRLESGSRRFNLFFYCSRGNYVFKAKKNVHIVHFPTKPLVVQKKDANPLVIFYEKLKDKAYVKNYDLFLPNSKFTEKHFKQTWRGIDDKKLNRAIKLCYPPSTQIADAPNNKKEKTILVISRIEQSKKLETLIDAYSKSKYLTKNYKLVIAGGLSEPLKGYYDHLKEYAAGKNIEFVANGSFAKITELYHKAQIFWHSKGYQVDESKEPELMEHFGMSTVEAMSAGCIPIVINQGGQKEIVTEGCGYKWNSVQELIERTEEIAKSPTKQRKISQAAKERAKEFNLDAFIENLYKILVENLPL